MSKEMVMKFYDDLVSSSPKKKENGEKPLFLAATVNYIIHNNLYGVELLELMYVRHTRLIKNLFIRLADGKLSDPEAYWRLITNPIHPGMKNTVEEFISQNGDVSVAFAKLSPRDAQEIFNHMTSRMQNRNMQLEAE
jgi:hypothetical protein